MVIQEAYVPVWDFRAQRGFFIAELLVVVAIVAIIALIAAIGTPEIFQSRRAALQIPAAGSVRKINSSGVSYGPTYLGEGSPVSPEALSGVDAGTEAREQICLASRHPEPCGVRHVGKKK